MKFIFSILIAFSLTNCATIPKGDTAFTEMAGRPVNIRLIGQKEMCEREPESLLCDVEDDEIDNTTESDNL